MAPLGLSDVIMEDGLLSLKWNNHKTTFFDILRVLREKVMYNNSITLLLVLFVLWFLVDTYCICYVMVCIYHIDFIISGIFIEV